MSVQTAGALESFATKIATNIPIPTLKSLAVFLHHVGSQLDSGVEHLVARRTGLSTLLLMYVTTEAAPGGENLATAVFAGDFFV